MARVVFLWNDHPTEHVAWHHMNEAKKIVEKHGYEVIPAKVDVEETNYGIVRKHDADGAAAKLFQARLLFDKKTVKRLEKEHNAPVFAFHTSPAEIMGDAENLPPEKFRITTSEDEEWKELFLGKRKRFSGYLVEVPAKYVDLPERVTRGIPEKIKKIREWLPGLEHETRDEYQLKHAPLNIPEQEKYKSRVISQMLADAILKHLADWEAETKP